MEEIERAEVTLEGGIAGDFRGAMKGKPYKRQVTLMEAGDWDCAMAELGHNIGWAERRVNLLVEALDLPQRGGTLLHIGENVVLEVTLDDELGLDDYVVNFRRMFGDARMDAVLGSVDGSVRFFGLTPTSMKLEGLDRHHRLIDSYKKLHVARANAAAIIS